MQPTSERAQGAPGSSHRIPKGSLADSFRYAFSGLGYALRIERNPRIQLAIALLVIAVGLWLGLTSAEWGLIIAAIAFVFVAEMVNTVAELVVDMIILDHHPLAKQAKDVAAGAVLVAAFAAAAIGIVILGPPLWCKLSALL